MKYLNIILRVFLGLLFIASAILKLFPIEAFDAKILEQIPFVGWTFSMILARVIIGFELTLGILIIAGFWTRKIVYPITLAMLVFFTITLIYSLVRFGNQPNCGCFGELLPFSNLESLFKNLVLIVLTFYLYKKSSNKSYKYWWISLIVLAVSIFAVFWTHKIPLYNDGDVEFKKEIKASYLHRNIFEGDTVNLNKEHLMVFVSPHCPACKRITRDLQTINEIYKFKDTYMFINSKDSNAIELLYPNKKAPFPYQVIEPDTFSTYIIAPYLPIIALVDENGIYKKLWVSSNFNLNKVIPYLRQEGILEK
jgi:uncharacterized membrane protein YphA (DoxX/SURF4 family)